MARLRRGYSREFPVHGDTGRRYMLDDIPAGFWTTVRAKAKRENISLRSLILRLLRQWLTGETVLSAPEAVEQSEKQSA